MIKLNNLTIFHLKLMSLETLKSQTYVTKNSLIWSIQRNPMKLNQLKQTILKSNFQVTKYNERKQRTMEKGNPPPYHIRSAESRKIVNVHNRKWKPKLKIIGRTNKSDTHLSRPKRKALDLGKNKIAETQLVLGLGLVRSASTPRSHGVDAATLETTPLN